MEIGFKGIDITKFLEKSTVERKTSSKEEGNFASVLESKSNEISNKSRDSKTKVYNQEDYSNEENIEINDIPDEEKLINDINKEDNDFNIEDLILLLSLFNSKNNQELNIENIDLSDLDYDITFIEDIHSYISSEEFNLEEFNSFLENIIESSNIKNSNLLDVNNGKLNNFFNNLIKEINEMKETQIIEEDLSNNLSLKEVLSKVLNDDNNEVLVDLQVLKDKLGVLKGNSNTEIIKENIVQVENLVTSDEIKLETNFILDNENLSQDENKEELTKEDKFLSKLISSDNKNSFDLNLQRVQKFSKFTETNTQISINKFTINSDIKNVINHMSLNNIKELVVKVNPGNLGEIAVKLIAEGDKMKAVINISEKETYTLINSSDIKQHLSNENIKISEVEISLYKDDTSFFNEKEKFADERNNKNHGTKNEFIEIDEELEKEMDITSLNIMV